LARDSRHLARRSLSRIDALRERTRQAAARSSGDRSASSSVATSPRRKLATRGGISIALGLGDDRAKEGHALVVFPCRHLQPCLLPQLPELAGLQPPLDARDERGGIFSPSLLESSLRRCWL